jgi:hypothetical protein
VPSAKLSSFNQSLAHFAEDDPNHPKPPLSSRHS